MLNCTVSVLQATTTHRTFQQHKAPRIRLWKGQLDEGLKVMGHAMMTFSPKKLLTTGALESKMSAPVPPSETFNEALRHGSRCGR